MFMGNSSSLNKEGGLNFPGSAFLESTLCGNIRDVSDSPKQGERKSVRLWQKVDTLCGGPSRDEENHSLDGSASHLEFDELDYDDEYENDVYKNYEDIDEQGKEDDSRTVDTRDAGTATSGHGDDNDATATTASGSATGTEPSIPRSNPTSALLARALVSEVTDNPKTMTPAAMTEREKKLLKAQEAAKKAKKDKAGPKPVGAPGGVGQPNLLGSLAHAVGVAGATGSTNNDQDGTEINSSQNPSILPPNSMQQNRAQVNQTSASNDANHPYENSVVSGKHTVTIGLSLSRRHSTVGHPDTVTRQTAFDFNELQDRQYKYVSSTDSTGWRAGGGERGGSSLGQSSNAAVVSNAEEDAMLDEFGTAPLHNGVPTHQQGNKANTPTSSSTPPPGAHYKVAAPDTVHIPVIHIDADSPQQVDSIINALARGEVFIPHMAVLPEALSVNGISPPDLVVRFGCERNDDVPPDEWPNWCLEFMHNQLYEYFFSVGARWMKRPFSITLAKKVRWKTVKHMNRYFAHAERVIDAWREKGPQYLDPQLSYIEGGATPEEVARPHGIYLLRNGVPTNYFAPNFDPPYTTKMTRSLLLNVLGKSWDKKRREWTSEPVPRLVTPSVLMASMCGCADPASGGFMANEVTQVDFSHTSNISDQRLITRDEDHKQANQHASSADHEAMSTPRSASNAGTTTPSATGAEKNVNTIINHEAPMTPSTAASANTPSSVCSPKHFNQNVGETQPQPVTSPRVPVDPEETGTTTTVNTNHSFESKSQSSPTISPSSANNTTPRHLSAEPDCTSSEEKKTDDYNITNTDQVNGNKGFVSQVSTKNTISSPRHHKKKSPVGASARKVGVLTPTKSHNHSNNNNEEEQAAPSEYGASVAASNTTVMHMNLSTAKFMERKNNNGSSVSSMEKQTISHNKTLLPKKQVATRQAQATNSNQTSNEFDPRVATTSNLAVSPYGVPSSDSGVSLEYSVDSSSIYYGDGSTTVGGSTLVGQNFAPDGSSVVSGYSQQHQQHKQQSSNSSTHSRSKKTRHHNHQVGHYRNHNQNLGGYLVNNQHNPNAISSEDEDGSASAFSLNHSISSEPIPTDEELFVVGWAKALDPSSGNYYYFTLDRTKTVWDNPLSANGMMLGGGGAGSVGGTTSATTTSGTSYSTTNSSAHSKNIVSGSNRRGHTAAI